KKYTDAIATLKQVIESSIENELDRWLFEAKSTLHDTYSKAGMHVLAYETLTDLKYQEDSIFNESKASIVGGLESSFDLLNEERRNALLVEEAENDELRIKNQQVTIILITTSALGILTIGFLSLKQQRTKRKLTEVKLESAKEKQLRTETELIHKNQELINFAVQITQKNEFIESLNEKIHHLNDASLTDVKELVKANETITKDREEFEGYVENVCQGFFIKLGERYPDITQSEKRLAALLRLELSSKEISTILNISPKSVDQSRYRLRQKMRLSTENSLTGSLKAL
ncbi:MAG: hypothetical protein AAFY41_11090, partial [Bacteroidota bacterium]